MNEPLFKMDLAAGPESKSNISYKGDPIDVIILVAAAIKNDPNLDHIVRGALHVIDNCPEELATVTNIIPIEQ
ncbi:hypothetical protein MAR621_03155 [Maribacter dokdonensis]|uniref:hypothetical protein n=1 Tax=Maribacter dokdonensis TaxID=320912 RepID=UPI001B0956F4|nr:hypothetical protein [Maribacter dokdonensis]CAG2532961.1 hypothetical protein MAR621_03155 [Maribacter dokdonensis]